jgi:hypothetical protein
MRSFNKELSVGREKTNYRCFISKSIFTWFNGRLTWRFKVLSCQVKDTSKDCSKIFAKYFCKYFPFFVVFLKKIASQNGTKILFEFLHNWD